MVVDRVIKKGGCNEYVSNLASVERDELKTDSPITGTYPMQRNRRKEKTSWFRIVFFFCFVSKIMRKEEILKASAHCTLLRSDCTTEQLVFLSFFHCFFSSDNDMTLTN